MPLSFKIKSALETLSRGSECIDAVSSMNSEENRFIRALEDLQHLAEKEHISLAIVGGLGAIHFGYPAATQEIDTAIDRRNLQSLLEASSRYGLKIARESKLGWHTLTHDDVGMNIVPEGGKARDTSPTVIPGPQQMGLDTGLHHAPIECWMELKISYGQQRDRAQVVEVLKALLSRS